MTAAAAGEGGRWGGWPCCRGLPGAAGTDGADSLGMAAIGLAGAYAIWALLDSFRFSSGQRPAPPAPRPACRPDAKRLLP